MKSFYRLSLLLAFFIVCSAAAFGQTTRIKFSPGATSAVVTGTLSGYKSHKTFIIRVRHGQTMTTSNAGTHHITVDITAPPGSTYEPDLAADCHDHQEVKPTAAGDYKITVTECQKADRWKGKFKLRVKVR
jgi:hypothetical protein